MTGVCYELAIFSGAFVGLLKGSIEDCKKSYLSLPYRLVSEKLSTLCNQKLFGML